jgi:hypothetical protein
MSLLDGLTVGRSKAITPRPHADVEDAHDDTTTLRAACQPTRLRLDHTRD